MFSTRFSKLLWPDLERRLKIYVAVFYHWHHTHFLLSNPLTCCNPAMPDPADPSGSAGLRVAAACLQSKIEAAFTRGGSQDFG